MQKSLRKLLEDEFSACADRLAEAHRYIEAFWENPGAIELAVRAFCFSEKKAELPCRGSPLEEYLYGELFNKIKPELGLRQYGFLNAPVLRPSISLYRDLWHSHFITALLHAEIIGPEEVPRDKQSPSTSWCRPLLSSPVEVDKIIGLDVLSHPSFVAFLKDLAVIRNITGGVIPIEIIHDVGPADVAADLLGYEGFLEGLYTHPQEMHKILELCTDYCLQIIQAQIDAAGWAKNKWAAPGMGASEMISPQVSLEQIREFFVPIRRRIAERFDTFYAAMNHPDAKALDLWLEQDGCRVFFFIDNYRWPADYVVPRMQGKATAVLNLNHCPGHLPCPSWEEHMTRFREFTGKIKLQINLTGLVPPRAQERALQHLEDLQCAWDKSNDKHQVKNK